MDPHFLSTFFVVAPGPDALVLIRIFTAVVLIILFFIWFIFLGTAPLHPIGRWIGLLAFALWDVPAIWVCLHLTPIMAAKLLLANILVLGAVFTSLVAFFTLLDMSLPATSPLKSAPLIKLFSMVQWQTALEMMEKHAELARDLSMMQAEYMRVQLDGLNQRLKQTIEPEVKDITKSLLKSVSPLAVLFFKREHNPFAWGAAALNAGRTLFSYFVDSGHEEKSQ
jgi:hypothetical protein